MWPLPSIVLEAEDQKKCRDGQRRKLLKVLEQGTSLFFSLVWEDKKTMGCRAILWRSSCPPTSFFSPVRRYGRICEKFSSYKKRAEEGGGGGQQRGNLWYAQTHPSHQPLFFGVEELSPNLPWSIFLQLFLFSSSLLTSGWNFLLPDRDYSGRIAGLSRAVLQLLSDDVEAPSNLA